MKSVAFKVNKNGHDYISTVLVPANHSEEAPSSNTWGFVIAGALLMITATFVCLLLLAA